MVRAVAVRAALLATAVISLATLGAQAPASAAAPRFSDPQIGPHARDEQLHRSDVLRFTPARSAIVPLRVRAARTAAPAGSSVAALATPPILQKEVFGFAPYWELANNGNWDYTLLSTVAFFGLDINMDGSISTSTPGWTAWNSQQLVDTINRAHYAGDRVVLVIKTFDEATINQIVTTPAVTQATIANTINAIASKNLDGVNVDFEGYTSATYPNIQSGYTNFIGQLSQQVHQRWPAAMVTADTYSGSASWDGGLFNIGQLAPEVDGLFVMAYDEVFGNMPGQAGPNAPLNGWTYNDTLAVSQYLSKAPAKRIILGVPYYGYKWSTTGTQPYAPTSGGATSDTYSGIVADNACALQMTRYWDSTAQSPWETWWSPASGDPCGGNHNSWRELYYDDGTSLGLKYDLVNNAGLLGTGMWALGYDNGYRDLWQVIADKFANPWPGQYHPLVPARVLDTRNGTGGLFSPLGGGQSIDVAVSGRGGVPASGVAAVVMNATVTNTSSASYLSIYSSGEARPNASTLNFSRGQTNANLVEVPVSRTGRVTIYNAAGSVDVMLDVSGWVSSTSFSSGTAGQYHGLNPARVLDTRVGTGGFTSPLGQGQTLDLPVSGHGGVPASGVSAVVLNLTVTNATMGSFVSAYPTGAARPLTSNLNFVAGQTVANRVIVPVGSNGSVTLYNAAGTSDLIADVSGWYSDASAASPGSGLFTGLSPTRTLDTRDGTGGIRGAVRAGSIALSVAGQRGVPAMSDSVPPTAVVVNVTVTNTTAPSYLTVFPNGTSVPLASDLNFMSGSTVAGLVIARLGADGKVAIYNAAGQTDVIVDVLGWYN